MVVRGGQVPVTVAPEVFGMKSLFMNYHTHAIFENPDFLIKFVYLSEFLLLYIVVVTAP